MAKAYERLPLTGGLNFNTGNNRPLAVSKSAPSSNKSESDHQAMLFSFLILNERRHEIFRDIYHVPNGGHRHAAVAVKLKAEGVRAGIFDVHLDAARRGFHGLKIELKVERNDLSDDQKRFRRRHIEENYCSHTVWHYAEAIDLILWYLGIDKRDVQGYPRSVVLPGKGGHDARCGCDIKINRSK